MYKISIIIPCFNEFKTIIKIIDKVKKFTKYEKEIIVVDDGSNDGTQDLLKNLNNNDIKFFFHKKNFGKGRAIKTALEFVTGDLIIIQDADLEYDPINYSQLIKPFEETDADVVYGSRFLGGGDYVRIHFFWHYIANKILTFLCNIITNLNMTDMETGYKVFRSEVLKSINIYENSFAIEPEITIKLARKKYKFFEVPISYNGRSYEEGKKIRLKDAFIGIFCLIKYGFFYKISKK
jgi:glycosyltransferase involved in cell wall biosynthesis